MADTNRPLTIPAALDIAGPRFDAAPAYAQTGASVTWGELQRRVNETAAGLVALGFGRGDRLAICAENGIDWIVTYLATVVAGGVGVLVYFELQAQEIENQVGRPGCRFLAASAGVLARLPDSIDCVEQVILLGDGSAEVDGALNVVQVAEAATQESRAALVGRAPAPDDLAAVIYTSGTTGGAKGVMLSHRNFMANAHSVWQAIDFDGKDSLLVVLPMHHAMPFIACIVLPMLVGAHVFIENDLRRVRDRLQDQKPTIFFGVPALYEVVYRNILARAEAEGRLKTLQTMQRLVRRIKQATGVNIGPVVFHKVHAALGGRLRFLVSGGAALSPTTARDYMSLGLPLLQGWGMTEASPAVALQSFSKRRFLLTRFYEDHIGSVGKAVPGVEVRLIDVPEKDIRVATHGEGEVILRGDNVFVGYWDAPEETRAAKLDGWLRTGDLGRIDKDGNIYLTGRSKYVIVLESGEKVYPDELEDNLSRSELVEDVCILGRKVRDRTQVTAIIYPSVEAARERASDAAGLQSLLDADVDRLSRNLAAYKRVSRVELSDAPLPKTALRKIARGQIEDAYSFDYGKWLTSSDLGAE